MSGHRVNILAGYSGHGLVVAEAAILSGIDLKHYCDKAPSPNNPFHLDHVGFEGDAAFEFWECECSFLLGIGDNLARRKVADKVREKGKLMLNAIHPSAIISRTASLGSGILIGPNVTVNPMAQIGHGVILNSGSIVEHGCVVEDFCHIAPSAVLLGDVFVGEGAFVGANAVVKQGLRIGKGAIIGMGAVVLHDVEENTVVVGNPTKAIRHNGR